VSSGTLNIAQPTIFNTMLQQLQVSFGIAFAIFTV